MNYAEGRAMCMTPDGGPALGLNRCACCGRKLTEQTGRVESTSGNYCPLCWESSAVWIPEQFDRYSWQVDLAGEIVDMEVIA
ncbi:hypothetical protein [Methanogenium cariaci]|jgi:hypothetical protein|uniref:hypothetical protein n=1 Tax=Methanogenium cariaci TaxID=2197 RepID=UPI0007829F15|nr:hypothetical protein [Methanogenium cariaci]